MFGAVFDADEELLSSTPNNAPVIKPEPCGSGGGAGALSLPGRRGLGDGALEGGAVDVGLSFFAGFVVLGPVAEPLLPPAAATAVGAAAAAEVPVSEAWAGLVAGSESISMFTGCWSRLIFSVGGPGIDPDVVDG